MGHLNTLALIAMVLSPPKTSNVGGPRPRKKMSNRGKEGRKWRQRQEEEGKRKKDTETQRGERMSEPEHLASTLPLLFASAADVVVRKGGAKKISIKL